MSVTGSGLGRLDVLHIGGAARPAEELPDPSQCALWAHAFAATAVHTEGTSDPVETTTGAALSGCRLVAPRRLQPQTSYIAALVPTFSAAALAGLGRSDQEVAAALAAPQPTFAWSTSDASVDLPVYLHWEFSCGAGGDFESLARAMHEVSVPPTFGTRPLDLGLAGAGMPVTTSLGTVFRGALTAPGIAAQPAWPDPTDADQVSVDAPSSARSPPPPPSPRKPPPPCPTGGPPSGRCSTPGPPPGGSRSARRPRPRTGSTSSTATRGSGPSPASPPGCCAATSRT